MNVINQENEMNSKSERFELRLEREMLDRLDTWSAGFGDGCSRVEAVRRLTEMGLQQFDKEPVRLSDGEKMIISMLCDLFRRQNLKDGELDYEFINSALTGGHYWGLARKYYGIFHGHQDNIQIVSEVSNILDMWAILESVYERLTNEQKEQIVAELGSAGKDVHFPGFDGNYEGEYLGIAGFFVDSLKLFQTFKNRDLNSHIPLLDQYRKMLEVFEGIRSSLRYGELSASHIIEILRARRQ